MPPELRSRTMRLILCIIALVAFGCDKIEESIEEEARREAADRAGQQTPEPMLPEQADPDAIILNTAQPNFGLLDGNTTVTLIGQGFQPGNTVTFGGSAVAADDVIWTNENSLTVTAPLASEEGEVDIVVSDPAKDRSSTLTNGFTYVREPGIASVTPERGLVDGGGFVDIQGNGFIAGTEVYFGDVQADVIDRSLGNMRVVVPPLPFDVYSVNVRNIVGAAQAQDAFQTFERLRIDEVRPVIGALAGGSSVLVEGAGFVPGTTLTLGGTQYPEPEANRRENELVVIAGPGIAEGPVDARVENLNGVDLIRDGFVYLDFSNATPRVAAIIPRAAPIEGNSAITLVGVGFDDPDVVVRFGEEPGDCFAESINVIRCITPPGEGPVDVEVQSGPTLITAEDGLTYVPLRVDAVVDSQGAIAGGTFVRIFGDGFDNDPQVFFDGRPASEVLAVSPTEINARTPRGVVGTVNVAVESFGLSRTKVDGFTYFDSDADLAWVSGGPINGSVNVTIIDTGTGDPVPNAFVMVGVDDAQFSGRTDTQGQVVISEPGLVGPVNVTAAGTPTLGGFVRFTYAGVNAQNLRIPFNGPSEANNQGPAGGGGAPPVIRGRVVRLKDQFNDDNDIVRVTTTRALLNREVPSAPEFINSGAYEFASRNGDLVVVALVGTFVEDDFVVKTMGFSPPFNAVIGETYDDVDIVVDTPLDTVLRLELQDPPFGEDDFGGEPNIGGFRVFYDFGGAGVLPMGERHGLRSNILTLPMPTALPEPHTGLPFNVLARAFYWPEFIPDFDFFGLGVFDVPYSEANIGERTDASQVIVSEPMLAVSNPNIEGLTTVLNEPLRFDVSANRPDAPTANRYVIRNDLGQRVWWVVTPGGTTSFSLPRPDIEGIDLPAGPYSVQAWRHRTPGMEFNSMDYEGLIRSRYRSVQVFSFFIPAE